MTRQLAIRIEGIEVFAFHRVNASTPATSERHERSGGAACSRD